MHWSCKYIGLPYRQGGRGPDGFDCWGILRLIYQNELGIPLPELPGISAETALHIHGETRKQLVEAEWEEIDRPADLCAVGMSQKEAVHHVGVWASADRGKIIHCWKSSAVVADTLERIRLKGFLGIHFYKHRLWPTSLKPKTP